MEIKRPNREDDQRAFRIRRNAKQGHYVDPQDLKWILKLYRTYPEWTTELNDRVFQATKPFGS